MVALSAIAKAMRDILGDEYVAGMWRRTLEKDLFWYVSRHPTKITPRPNTYLALSWPWVAADGSVKTGGPISDSKFEVTTTQAWSKAAGCGYATDFQVGGLYIGVMLDVLQDNFEEQNAKNSLYCMLGGYYDDRNEKYALILEIEDPRKGVYRRIGILRTSSRKFMEEITASSVREDNFPCEEYRDGLHLIRII
ncbi:hypothetical protein GQ44DRAFT_723558 [Phaeosphaeriaceae sp. PMI808]|nr:hypothetical protein GQ44DRAFT_723558 [Phaeosphaeriaceae sp. PMI808]